MVLSSFIRSNIHLVYQEIEKFNMKLEKGKPVIVSSTANFCRKQLRTLAPQGIRPEGRALKNSFITLVTKDRAEISLMGHDNEFIALANEYGVKKHFVPFSVGGFIEEWARVKAPGFLSKGGVIVGGKGTRLGKDNKFMGRAFRLTNRQSDIIVDNEILVALTG